MRALILLVLVMASSCGKPDKPASAYCRDRDYMIRQCLAEAARDYPDPSLRDYQALVCDNLYPRGLNCFEDKDDYFR